ncbi:unnamed protein product [Vitrella brassicaformis CCMP3155]|uniref:C-type lectin domain-containing protein n=2 Tax=Vitrella brassicaformis TaxID=1169539 RepID=A0A0G4GVE6_VITBC|nr:unnamed protein product [Vitrella brassicaformis CCMP3155]|eukprot:CEM34720.1 unnamed protein product [Vitrella brassicaformis CCMP3155]
MDFFLVLLALLACLVTGGQAGGSIFGLFHQRRLQKGKGTVCSASSPGWTLFEGNCYRAYGAPLPYLLARSYCQGEGAELASIHSPTENEILHALCQLNSQHYGECWVGLSREEGHGEFTTWSDGTPIDWTNWDLTNGIEPNNAPAPGDCARMVAGNGAWRDTRCSARKSFLCEMPATAPWGPVGSSYAWRLSNISPLPSPFRLRQVILSADDKCRDVIPVSSIRSVSMSAVLEQVNQTALLTAVAPDNLSLEENWLTCEPLDGFVCPSGSVVIEFDFGSPQDVRCVFVGYEDANLGQPRRSQEDIEPTVSSWSIEQWIPPLLLDTTQAGTETPAAATEVPPDATEASAPLNETASHAEATTVRPQGTWGLALPFDVTATRDVLHRATIPRALTDSSGLVWTRKAHEDTTLRVPVWGIDPSAWNRPCGPAEGQDGFVLGLNDSDVTVLPTRVDSERRPKPLLRIVPMIRSDIPHSIDVFTGAPGASEQGEESQQQGNEMDGSDETAPTPEPLGKGYTEIDVNRCQGEMKDIRVRCPDDDANCSALNGIPLTLVQGAKEPRRVLQELPPVEEDDSLAPSADASVDCTAPQWLETSAFVAGEPGAYDVCICWDKCDDIKQWELIGDLVATGVYSMNESTLLPTMEGGAPFSLTVPGFALPSLAQGLESKLFISPFPLRSDGTPVMPTGACHPPLREGEPAEEQQSRPQEEGAQPSLHDLYEHRKNVDQLHQSFTIAPMTPAPNDSAEGEGEPSDASSGGFMDSTSSQRLAIEVKGLACKELNDCLPPPWAPLPSLQMWANLSASLSLVTVQRRLQAPDEPPDESQGESPNQSPDVEPPEETSSEASAEAPDEAADTAPDEAQNDATDGGDMTNTTVDATQLGAGMKGAAFVALIDSFPFEICHCAENCMNVSQWRSLGQLSFNFSAQLRDILSPTEASPATGQAIPTEPPAAAAALPSVESPAGPRPFAEGEAPAGDETPAESSAAGEAPAGDSTSEEGPAGDSELPAADSAAEEAPAGDESQVAEDRQPAGSSELTEGGSGPEQQAAQAMEENPALGRAPNFASEPLDGNDAGSGDDETDLPKQKKGSKAWGAFGFTAIFLLGLLFLLSCAWVCVRRIWKNSRPRLFSYCLIPKEEGYQSSSSTGEKDRELLPRYQPMATALPPRQPYSSSFSYI